MARIEDLVKKYYNHIAAPWQKSLAGAQRTIFIVYPKSDERRLRTRLDLFEMETKRAGHEWRLFDFTGTFSRWMSTTEYREAYFEEPDNISMRLRSEFAGYVARELREVLTHEQTGADTVVAVYGVASLYGLTKASLILKEVEHDIRGRLVLFFPGSHENSNYRLLDARDGWNYLAVPITLHNGVNDI